jgi:hypothetical protein
MTDEPKDQEEPQEEPAYCQQCGDPITGSDQFCAGCGAPAGEQHEHAEEG